MIAPPIEFEVDAPTIVDFDWICSYGGDVIHAPGRDTEDDDWYESGGIADFPTACGRTLKWASIPGMFTRMGSKRCDRCCDKLGYPRGVGSPKNEDAIRAIRGWV